MEFVLSRSDSKPPEMLYKYRSLAPDALPYVEKMFSSQELWYAAPESFNDPFESRFTLHTDASRDKKLSFLADTLLEDSGHDENIAKARAEEALTYGAEYFHTVEASIRDNLTASARRDPAVLSLSGRPDHILLWSHYANCHKGICIGFRTDGDYLSKAVPVLYQEEFPRVSLYESTHDERAEKASLTKSSIWSYEEEWRVVVVPSPHYKAAGARPFPPTSLRQVILGAEIGDEEREEVLRWVDAYPHPIDVCEARLLPDKYSVKVAPVGSE